ADANLAGVLAQHIDELQANRIAERLSDLRDPLRLVALDIGVDDGFAARLPSRPLGFRRELQIDVHQSQDIDWTHACQSNTLRAAVLDTYAKSAGRDNLRREQTMRYVLFVCNHNAGRSQMAQAFFERYAPEDVLGESAGQDPAK